MTSAKTRSDVHNTVARVVNEVLLRRNRLDRNSATNTTQIVATAAAAVAALPLRQQKRVWARPGDVTDIITALAQDRP